MTRRRAGLLDAQPARLAGWVAAWLLVVCAARAEAQPQRDLDGVLSASTLVQRACSTDACDRAGIGGALTLDVLQSLRGAPWLALGGMLGVGVVDGEAESTRVFVPVGVSIVAGAFPSETRRFGVEGRLRAGGWVGGGAWGNLARAELGGGAFVTGGVHVSVGLGDPSSRARLRLTVGFDLTRLFGTRPVTLYAPGIALAWRGDHRTAGASP